MWAAWVIFQAVREGDPELIKIEFSTGEDGKETFLMTIDRARLRTSGFKALSEFLHKLHVYKSMGDFESGQKFFEHYSGVGEEMLRVRDIIIANKKPRRLELQPNLLLKGAGSLEVEYRGYSEDFEGIITSYCERFPDAFLADVYHTWCETAHQTQNLRRHPFEGEFADPNHMEGYRRISVADGVCTIVGCDAPGRPEWTFVQPVVNGTEMLVDFSPKGGPKDLLAKWDARRNGIAFPDGNCWFKIK